MVKAKLMYSEGESGTEGLQFLEILLNKPRIKTDSLNLITGEGRISQKSQLTNKTIACPKTTKLQQQVSMTLRRVEALIRFDHI